MYQIALGRRTKSKTEGNVEAVVPEDAHISISDSVNLVKILLIYIMLYCHVLVPSNNCKIGLICFQIDLGNITESKERGNVEAKIAEAVHISESDTVDMVNIIVIYFMLWYYINDIIY